MKNHNQVRMSMLLGLGLLMGATDASADPQIQPTVPQNQTPTVGDLVGTDTMEDIAKALLAGAGISTPDANPADGPGITNYSGLGSSPAQRQLMGAADAGEPTCTTTFGAVAGDANWGCQEVAPMSRQMNAAICANDADDSRDADDSATSNSTAEGLIVGLESIAVITDNASHRQFSTAGLAACVPGTNVAPDQVWGPSSDNSVSIPSAAYASSGQLKTTPAPAIGATGYTIGTGIPAWMDVLRLIYTGCKNTDGLCALATAGDRITRCSASSNPVRAAIVNNYGNIFEGTECTEKHCAQLRQAYRRDDVSGTTSFMLDTLGLRTNGDSLRTRTRMAPLFPLLGTIGFSPIPEHIFCDGGDKEGIWPAPYTGVIPVMLAPAAIIGDPLQRTCALEDDLCGAKGTIGIVRPIRTPLTFGYPAVQCTRHAFVKMPWPTNPSGVPTCPNGIVPTPLGCPAPYYLDSSGIPNFDCLNTSNSRWSGDPITLDGRAYNFAWRLFNGNLSDRNHVAANLAPLPEVAQWRQNQSTLNTAILAAPGGPFGMPPVGSNTSYAADPAQAAFMKSYAGTAGKVCQQASASDVIGCVVGNTRCTIGFSGREVALKAPADDTQEVIRLPGLDGIPSVPTDPQIIMGNYPISRPLYLNAIGGLENILADCAARIPGGVPNEYCTDEAAFARELYSMPATARAAFSDNGAIPLIDPGTCGGGDAVCAAMKSLWLNSCVGATGATGCGRNTVQPRTECDPDGQSPAVPTAALPNCSTNFSAASGANNTCG